MKSKEKKYKQLTWEDRLKIEALYNAGVKVTDIAKQLGYHHSTIYRELSRGKTTKRNYDWTDSVIYSPELAQSKTETNRKERGREMKIGNDYKFLRFVEHKILEDKYSPAATLAYIKVNNINFETEVCLTTLYNYIKKGVFLNITMAECPYRKTKKKRNKNKVQKRLQRGTSITDRPVDIETREELGHWEMDTVVGAQGKGKGSLLVLTERKTRNEIIEKLNEHTSDEVVKALNRIERRIGEKTFREKFKTITVDNGCEFADAEGIERSRRNKKKRTKVYYCHPYRSSERGSNENNNKLVRRWHPKGSIFDDVKPSEVKMIEAWMNDYPRKIFGWKTSNQVLQEELGRVAM